MYLLKNMNMILKRTAENFWNKNKYLINLATKGVMKILELNWETNYDDLTYHFKHRNIPENISIGFDNAISFLKKIRDRNITPEKTIKDQNEYKSGLAEIKGQEIKQNNKIVHYAKLKRFTKQETDFINFLMVVLQLHLYLNLR